MWEENALNLNTANKIFSALAKAPYATRTSCKPLDNIKIRFSTWIPIPQFVLFTSPEIHHYNFSLTPSHTEHHTLNLRTLEIENKTNSMVSSTEEAE